MQKLAASVRGAAVAIDERQMSVANRRAKEVECVSVFPEMLRRDVITSTAGCMMIFRLLPNPEIMNRRA